jgi:hypothetical protein
MAVKQVFNTSAELDFPNVLPTLDLDFANSKTLDPRIDFTRASGGSYVGADGLIKYAGVNEARFDHDPVTGECRGLLIEASRQNLLTYSEEFSNASWTTNSLQISVSPNATTSPAGDLTADKIIPNTTNASHIFRQFSSVTSGLTYTQSIYAKSGEYSVLQFTFSTGFDGGGSLYRNFILSNGSLGNGTIPVSAVSVTPVGNGWYRILITATATSTVASGRFNINVLNADISSVNPSYSGDGTSGLYLWGAQLELGSFPTSYIPTVASTRTRAADNASITGKNFSEWYRQDEGTIFSQSDVPKISLGVVYYITETTLDDIIGLRGANSGTTVQFLAFSVSRSSNVFVYQISNTDRFKGSLAYETDNTIASFNGILSPIDSTVSIPNPTSLQIGKISTNTRYLNGRISRLTYFPKRLPNSQLQALTS